MANVRAQLNSTDLPWPQQDGGYQIEYEYRGEVVEMADGSHNIDLVASGLKRVVTLTWVNISQTDKNTIQTILGTVGTSSTTLKTVENESFSVTLPTIKPVIRWTSIGTPNGSAYNAGSPAAHISQVYSGSLVLREV